MLATEYALTQPSGLASLVLASPVLSVLRWIQDQISLLDTLPCAVQVTIYRHEVLGTVDSQEYRAAM